MENFNTPMRAFLSTVLIGLKMIFGLGGEREPSVRFFHELHTHASAIFTEVSIRRNKDAFDRGELRKRQIRENPQLLCESINQLRNLIKQLFWVADENVVRLVESSLDDLPLNMHSYISLSLCGFG